jgi:hypothetical protein
MPRNLVRQLLCMQCAHYQCSVLARQQVHAAILPYRSQTVVLVCMYQSWVLVSLVDPAGLALLFSFVMSVWNAKGVDLVWFPVTNSHLLL